MIETDSGQDALLPNICEKSQLIYPLNGLTGSANSFSPCSILPFVSIIISSHATLNDLATVVFIPSYTANVQSEITYNFKALH